ncbi:MAG: DASH family cryptochrome [Lishizhenia sp.]
MEYKNTHIHWFRNDLRLHDQPFLQKVDNCENLICIYILNPKQFQYVHWDDRKLGFRKQGLNRIQFLRETLCDLQQNLRSRGNDLLVKVGNPAEILKDLSSKNNTSVSFEIGYATEEKLEQEEVYNSINDEDIHAYEGGFLIHPETLPFPFDKFPNGFSSFRNKIEKKRDNTNFNTLLIPENIPPSPERFPELKPSQRKLLPEAAFKFRGGESAGLERLNYYLFESEEILNYKRKRNGSVGTDYSGKFSAWLANGSLSPTQIMKEIKRFENEIKANDGTYWMWFELLWRDFFRYIGKKNGGKLFHTSGLNGKPLKFRQNLDVFSNWCSGNTTSAFVNAHLVELHQTGFMSNRGRQNVASFLFHDLGIDWRFGAAWFEHALLDYDVYSNYGNWLYIVGVGNDPKGGRKFDVEWQQDRYDPERDHEKVWLRN